MRSSARNRVGFPCFQTRPGREHHSSHAQTDFSRARMREPIGLDAAGSSSAALHKPSKSVKKTSVNLTCQDAHNTARSNTARAEATGLPTAGWAQQLFQCLQVFAGGLPAGFCNAIESFRSDIPGLSTAGSGAAVQQERRSGTSQPSRRSRQWTNGGAIGYPPCLGLIVSKGNDGIDAHGAPSGSVGSRQCHQE
jgi:hypothetical protein